mmetsp:Transcript_25649/g.86000  ORF Transcript_25649/g.86000 Transcript_25649/m.86000 type:complete len:223 (+) Transcript_25649:57-725(+)
MAGVALVLAAYASVQGSPSGPRGAPAALQHVPMAPAVAGGATRRNCFRALVSGTAAVVLATAPQSGLLAARADVVGDLLPPCATRSCVSSQDDRPAVWDNPWEYDGSPEHAMGAIRNYLEGPEGARVEEATDRYIRAVVDVGPGVRDELELYLTPGDNLVQFRAERSGPPDLGANRRRLERMRARLGYGKLPVMRDRRTVLWFDSPLDSFGPAEYDSAEPLR